MLNYAIRRTTSVAPAIAGVVTLVFLMLRMIPGDPAAYIGGEGMSAEALEGLRERLGLNEPLLLQYVHYVTDLFRFDLGHSIHTNLPITTVIANAMPVTAIVAILAIIVGTLISVPLGAVAAYAKYRGNDAADSGLTVFAMVIDTLPSFWVSLLLMLFLSLQLGWFPISGPIDWGDPIYMAKRLALPVIVLGTAQIASVARVTRTSVLQTLEEDYIRTARSLGASERSILFRHALPNAALPIITITGLSVGRLFSGTVITESIFSLPGMGTQLINSIYSRDYPVVQGLILSYAVIFVVVNVVTDLVYTRVDPRVRLS
ncbi:MAG: ABC transporter permease [Dehalococcoidia bacterium]